MALQRTQVHNLAAGPSPLPTAVLQKAAEGLLNYGGTGMGVCELSHRGKEFKAIIEGAEADLRKLLSIPDNYAVIFSQGGGTQQFSATVLNLLSYRRLQHESKSSTATYEPPTIDYVVTGSWSSKASAEAKRLVQPTSPDQAPLAKVHIAASTKSTTFTTLPKKEDYKFSKDPAFVYYCENETIHGVEFPTEDSSPYAFPFDLIPEDVPIVADYSSSFISRPIRNIERHAVIYAGAQKNLGPSGLTVIIVRKDLLVDTAEATLLGGVPVCPVVLEYKTMADNGSMYNTPPTFPIYVSSLVLTHLLSPEIGGITGLERTNRRKAEGLYAVLEQAREKGVLACKVKDEDARSWMNVTFDVIDREGEVKGQAQKDFVKGATELGFRQIEGHRSVGGMRASLYNAVTVETVDALVAYIKEYAKL